MMTCYYLSFLIEEIWLDLQDNILLGVILFSVLAKHNRICRIWTFQFIQGRPLGLAGRVFVLGWYQRAWVLHWHTIPLGLTSGMVSLFFSPYQKTNSTSSNFEESWLFNNKPL